VCHVHVRPALASLLLTLEGCREIDKRDGITVMVGDRSLAELGRLVAGMHGPGNRISAKTIEGYRQAITRSIKKALDALSRAVDRPLDAPIPILHRGYGQGYCLVDPGLLLIGVSRDDVVGRVRDEQARLPHGLSHRQPPK